MNNPKKILIIGAGVAGCELLEKIRLHFKGQYEVLGFIDDDETKLGKSVSGLQVLGTITDLKTILKKSRIDSIFIAIPSAEGKTIRQILEAARGSKVSFKIIPRTLELVQGRVKLDQLKNLDVSDLLGNAIIKSKQSKFRKGFKNKTILITGAAGSIGSELCRQLVQFSPKLLAALDWSENGLFELDQELSGLSRSNNFRCIISNIQDRSQVQDLVRKLKPHIIFHAAAFKHVPLLEEYVLEAIRNNIFGTENVAKIAYEEGVEKFIFISTDKAVDPKNVMGATKLIGEHIITRLNNLGGTEYIAVRFGNVLESHGSVVPIFRKQIANGGPVTVTDSRMMRYMMTIPEAVQLVLQSVMIGNGGEILTLNMGEQIRIVELAQCMIQLAGFIPNEDIKIKLTGIRPGEKLEERLITSQEYFEKTENEGIFKVSRSGENIDLYLLVDLHLAVETNDLKKARSILKKYTLNL